MDRILFYFGLFSLVVQLCFAEKGELRFLNGKTKYSGVLQVNHNGTWGTICNDTTWTTENTEVACKQLGFLGGAGIESDTLENEGTVPILMKRVNCSGEEWSLQDCSYVTATKGCQHDEDISIACIPPAVVSCVKTKNNKAVFVGKSNATQNVCSGSCLEFCRRFGFAFAAVTSNNCACGGETESVQESQKVPFEECKDSICPGDDTEYCGSDNTAIVYDVAAGNCGGRLVGEEGTVSSPGYPNRYLAGFHCIWVIELSNPDSKISVHDVNLAEGDEIKFEFPNAPGENFVIAHNEKTSYVKSTEEKLVRISFVSSTVSTGGEGFFLHFQDDTQCEVPSIGNGSLVHDPHIIYRPGDVVRVLCDKNLVYSNATVTCKSSGEWYPEPICSEYEAGLTLEFIRTALVMVIVGLIALGILFALTTIMLVCIKANEKRQSGYQGITTEIVEAPQSDSLQEERYTSLTKDDIKVQLHSPDEDGEMDNNANEQHVIPAAEEDMDLESPLEEASPADETVEDNESTA